MGDVTQQPGGDTTDIRPGGESAAIHSFQVHFPEADLTDLRRRIDATKWPEREPVTDPSQGVQLATIQKLARHWATDHDWRACEARLNALPQVLTEIDGLDIHFIHVRSKHPNALPLIVTQMANRPQTLYGIEDSPAGLAAWLLDHDARSYSLIARVFDGQPEGLTRDDVLDNITLYWLTHTAVSSARIYWENKFAFFAPKHVAVPVAVSAFPDEVLQTPRSWTERAYPRLIYYNKPDKGGHFAAWEQPQLFSREVRAGFRPLRGEQGSQPTVH